MPTSGPTTATQDLILALILGVLAAGYGWMTAGIPSSVLAGPVDAGALPTLLAIALGAMSLLLLISAWVRWTRHRLPSCQRITPTTDGQSIRSGLGLLFIGLGYLMLLPVLGYGISMALLITASTAMLERRLKMQHAVYGLLGAGTLYCLFVLLLGVPFPTGSVTSLGSNSENTESPSATHEIGSAMMGRR